MGDLEHYVNGEKEQHEFLEEDLTLAGPVSDLVLNSLTVASLRSVLVCSQLSALFEVVNNISFIH